MRTLVLLIATLALTGAGCSADKAPGTFGGALSRASTVALDGKPLALAGVTFVPPGIWKDTGAGGMRTASYAFGPVQGDADSATVVVFYFGQGGGGGVAANIERWLGQMSRPDGGDPAAAAARGDDLVDGMALHRVEAAGTYMGASMGGGMMGGGMMGGDGAGRPDYFMSAAVLEAPQGNLFFKLTGPEKTARQMNSQFLAALAAVKKAG